ncbi:MAG: 16S rRNA (uracil(1498)-N(3))-methyltransferase [Burkholderiales bacterium PBB1]|nr:MAG: 16S rRNA (uracil(1498)-N(3))-methyltransferase [Burkholderiales bacterium PBB1]
MLPRFFVPPPLKAGERCVLPPGPTRHVQVLRLQPGDAITLFDGHGGEWQACIEQMGRSVVSVQLLSHQPVDRELDFDVTIALGMPANERMDSVVEKATELGVAAIQPLICERSVLRLTGERADKKVAHWQAVAAAASEQCGRTRVPTVQPVRALSAWLAGLVPGSMGRRHVLSLRAGGHNIAAAQAGEPLLFLSGPEGGLSEAEEQAALQAGFQPLSLGPRVLRADTAPLAVLATLALSAR